MAPPTGGNNSTNDSTSSGSSPNDSTSSPSGSGAHVRPSFTQVIASALAAVSAAVISSTFGVAGTLIGAAIASVIASVGSTLYLASLRTTNERLRRLAAARRPGEPNADPPQETRSPRRERLRWSELRRGVPSLRRRWLAVAVLTLAVFGLAIGTLTVVEASTNKPVSALVGGGNGSGTSLGDVLNPTSKATPTPSPTPSPAPRVSEQPGPATPTPTPTRSPTATPTPTPSPSPGGPAATPSPSSSDSPSETPSPSPSATDPDAAP